MNHWYELSDKNIAEIEGAIDWFKNGEERLVNCLVVFWNVAGEEKKQLSEFINSETTKLERYYRLCTEKKIPHEVLTRLKEELKPFIIELE